MLRITEFQVREEIIRERATLPSAWAPGEVCSNFARVTVTNQDGFFRRRAWDSSEFAL